MHAIKTHCSLNLTFCKISQLSKHTNFKFNAKHKQPKGCIDRKEDITVNTHFSTLIGKGATQLRINAQGLPHNWISSNQNFQLFWLLM